MFRRLTAVVLASLIFLSSLGLAGFAMAEQVAAAGCSDPAYWFGRAKWCGYFKNGLDTSGEDVRPGGIPASVNTTQEFIAMVKGDLASGNAWRITAAQFTIQTMLGRGPGAPKSVTTGPGSQLEDWEKRVLTYGNISQNGTTSVGTNGRIDWFVWQHLACGVKNTFYQNAHDDIAPFENHSGNSDCEVASAMDDFVIFRNTSGGMVYQIRRECMNPMGTMSELSETPPPNFNLNPSIGTTVNGAASTVAQVGDSVQFTYNVNNTGTTPSTSVGCNTYASTYPEYHASGSAPPGGSPAGPSPGCPRIFAVGNTTVANEVINIATANQTICRTLTVNPATFGGGARTTNEVCVIVANKPYLKVYGGDISAGNGLETAIDTCTTTLNSNAKVVSWNERAAVGYAGAGVQYATFALNSITDFASAQGNAGGAPVPTGLSFANTTTNAPAGNFGGSFGSVSCIPDYYSRRPATTLGLPPTISAMNTGSYGATGTTTLPGTGVGSGNVTSGQKITVYVNGDVIINGNIVYPGNWNATSIPLFQLVARGNIYIGSNVTQLDGVYIAQRNAGAGGTIYTCASGTTAPTLTNGAFFNACNNKLTINGAFVANSVEFLRTAGTLSQSTVGESSGSNTAAEVFNFNPTLWMVQPVDNSGRVDNYDAITSLPPVL